MSATVTQQALPVPHSVDAERSVLGVILLDRTLTAYNQAAAILAPKDFFLDSNRRIFSAMMVLVEASKPVDAVSVAEELIRRSELEAVGGAAYLSSLTDDMPRFENIEHFCHIVKDKAIRRQGVYLCGQSGQELLENSGDTEAILSRFMDRLLALSNQGAQGGPLSLREGLEAEYGSLDGIAARERRAPGVSTGFLGLDDLTSGLKPQNLILIAGRPSMGKTALSLAISRHVGLSLRLPVMIFSLEMSRKEVLDRLVCAEARINSRRLHGGLSKEELKRVGIAQLRLAQAPIFIDELADLNLSALRARAQRIKQKHGLGLVIVDYIGLMNPPRAENRTQEISRLSRGLKIAAKELDVPLVVVSQLSRAPEQRTGDGHRPQLSDLRDSGSLEQDADLVCFLYREEYYLRMSNQPIPPDLAGTAELTIAKQRNGPTGSVPLVFMPEWAGFAGFHVNGGGLRG